VSDELCASERAAGKTLARLYAQMGDIVAEVEAQRGCLSSNTGDGFDLEEWQDWYNPPPRPDRTTVEIGAVSAWLFALADLTGDAPDLAPDFSNFAPEVGDWYTRATAFWDGWLAWADGDRDQEVTT